MVEARGMGARCILPSMHASNMSVSFVLAGISIPMTTLLRPWLVCRLYERGPFSSAKAADLRSVLTGNVAHPGLLQR